MGTANILQLAEQLCMYVDTFYSGKIQLEWTPMNLTKINNSLKNSNEKLITLIILIIIYS